MIFTAIGSAILGAGATAGAAFTVGAGVASVGAGMLGQAYTARQSALIQEKASRAANRRERLKQLATMRQRQRANQFIGVVSGTAGSSSQLGQQASIASQAAGNIGSSFREQNTASKLSSMNSKQTGFGVLQQAGEFALTMPGKVKDQSGVFGGTA